MNININKIYNDGFFFGFNIDNYILTNRFNLYLKSLERSNIEYLYIIFINGYYAGIKFRLKDNGIIYL